MDIINQLILIEANGGLGRIFNTFIDDWLVWIYLGGVAVFSLVFLKDRAWMKLLGFVAIAAVVGLLMFAGESIFGPGGAFTDIASDAANEVSYN